AISRMVRNVSTHLLNEEGDMPLRLVFTFGAMKPVPSRSAATAQALQSLAVRRRISLPGKSGQVLIRVLTESRVRALLEAASFELFSTRARKAAMNRSTVVSDAAPGALSPLAAAACDRMVFSTSARRNFATEN